MFKKIDNVVLVSRASKYAGGKCPETAGQSLKTRGKIEAVTVSQKRGCHRNAQSIRAVRFIADTVGNDDRRIPSGGGIDFSNHVVPGVSRSSWFGETNKLKPSRRTKLVRNSS